MMWTLQAVVAWFQAQYLFLEWTVLVWLGPDCAVNLAFAVLCFWTALACRGHARWAAGLAGLLYVVLALA